MSVSAAFFAISLPVELSPVSETMPDVLVLDDRVAGGDAVARHDVEHAGREDLGLGDQLREPEQRERRVLGRLDHDGVPGGERGSDLPGRHVQRVVPGGDQPGDADRLAAQDAREPLHVLAGGQPAEDPGARGEEPELVGDDRDLLGHREREDLAHVLRLEAPELVGVLLDQVGHPQQGSAPLPGRGVGPGLVVGLPGGGDRSVDVGRGRLRDLGDHVAVGGADDLAGLAVRGVRPLAADVHLVGLRVAHPDLTFLRRDPRGSNTAGQSMPKIGPNAGPAPHREGRFRFGASARSMGVRRWCRCAAT